MITMYKLTDVDIKDLKSIHGTIGRFLQRAKTTDTPSRRVELKTFALCIALFSGLAFAQITVPTEVPDIQTAVDLSEDGGVIYVEPGRYYGQVLIDKTLTITGTSENASDTVIVFNANFHAVDDDGERLGVRAIALRSYEDITLSNLTIRNTFDEAAARAEGERAHTIAARFDGRVTGNNVTFIGHSDVLQINGAGNFSNVKVVGTNDVVWGQGSATFTESTFVSIGPGNFFAPGGDRSNVFSVSGSKIVRAKGTDHTFHLARPWGATPMLVIRDSNMGEGVAPKGYSNPWGAERADDTFFYECDNFGVGSDTTYRVPWAKSC